MSEIINKPQPPVVRSGCKAPPPFRRIPGGAGKPGTKKGDSRKNLPHSHARQNYLLQHAPSAFSAQHDLVESHFSAQQDLDESHASASHFASQPAQAEASVAAAAAPLSAAFLFELPQQLTIATAAMTTTKEKIFFISVKGLIISYSVTSQRYIFARILQIKNFNIFKVFACFRQAGTAAACRLCQAQKTKKGIQLFSSKGLPWRTPRS